MYGKNKFNPFLILAVICTAFAEVTEVHQIPDKVDVLARQNASLQCSFELFKNKNNIRVYWWKTGEREFFKEGEDPRKMFKVESRASAALKIRNVRFGDAGVYYCRVEGEYTGNGTGVTLEVKATPEPMKILESQDADGSLLCKTSGFHPKDYSLTWYRDGQRITNGVKTNHQLNAERLTEASSYLHDTQPAQEGTIYKCEVSHSTLKAPASATYIVKPAEVSPITIPWWIPLCGVMFLLLLIIVAIASYKLCKARKGKVQMKTCVRCTQPIVVNPKNLNEETVQGNTQMAQWNPIPTAEITDATPKVKKHRKRKNDPMNI